MRQKKLPKQKSELLIDNKEHHFSLSGIKKAEWHVLHCLHDKACIYKKELAGLMKPFMDIVTLNRILIKFKITCIIFDPEEKVTLTSNGIALYRSFAKG